MLFFIFVLRFWERKVNRVIGNLFGWENFGNIEDFLVKIKILLGLVLNFIFFLGKYFDLNFF